MPRNTSGTYTLPAGNPVTSGTTISTTWANGTLGDLAAEISDSVSRSGKGSFSAAVRAPDGTVATPAYSFTNEIGSGIYRAAANDVRLAVGGVDALKLTSGGIAGPITLASGTTGIVVAGSGGFLLLQGNQAAGQVSTTANPADVVAQPTVARTAGFIFQVQNPPSVGKLGIDWQGLLQLQNAAAIQPANVWTGTGAGLSWTSNGVAQFKDANGIVHLKGSLTIRISPPTGDAINPLAAGFRPSATRKFAIATVSASNVEGAGVLTITATGTSTITGVFSVGDTAYVDGVSFLAEQ